MRDLLVVVRGPLIMQVQHKPQKKCNLVLTQRSMDPEKLQPFVNKNFKDPHLDFKTYNKGKSKPYGTEIIMGR